MLSGTVFWLQAMDSSSEVWVIEKKSLAVAQGLQLREAVANHAAD
jgi:hypothetical protein